MDPLLATPCQRGDTLPAGARRLYRSATELRSGPRSAWHETCISTPHANARHAGPPPPPGPVRMERAGLCLYPAPHTLPFSFSHSMAVVKTTHVRALDTVQRTCHNGVHADPVH